MPQVEVEGIDLSNESGRFDFAIVGESHTTHAVNPVEDSEGLEVGLVPVVTAQLYASPNGVVNVRLGLRPAGGCLRCIEEMASKGALKPVSS